MNLDFNPKITIAILSFAILAIAELLFLFSHDLFYWEPHIRTVEEGFERNYWNSINNIVGVGLFAVPVLIWHVSDLLTFKEQKSRLGRLLGSYKPVLYSMIVGIVGYAVVVSGLTERMQCWEAGKINASPDNNFFMLCHPNIYAGIEFLVLPFLVALLLLAVIKFAIAIHSPFKKAG